MKKVFAFILVLCMVLSCMPAMAATGTAYCEKCNMNTEAKFVINEAGGYDGEHVGVCAVCGTWSSDHAALMGGSTQTCTYDAATGKCEVCGGECPHDWAGSTKGTCTKCGFACTHAQKKYYSDNEGGVDHNYTCKTCGYTSNWELCYDANGYIGSGTSDDQLAFHGKRTCSVCGFSKDGTWGEKCAFEEKDGEMVCKFCGNKCQHKNQTTEPGTAAKCNKSEPFFTDGKTDKITCGDCKKVLQDAKDIKITEHQNIYYEKIEQEATCTVDGSKYIECGCGFKGNVTIPSSGAHEWVSEGVLKNCPESSVVDGESVSCEVATCTTVGYEHYTCSLCGAVKHEKIKAQGHEYTTKVLVNKKADDTIDYTAGSAVSTDCQKAVYSIMVCSHVVGENADGSAKICGAWDKKNITVVKEAEASGHEFAYSKTVAPTCIVDGYDLYVCQNEGCTKSERRNVKSLSNKDTVTHNDKSKWGIVDEKAATCTEKGYKVVKCPVCGETSKEVYAAKGHTNIGAKSGCFSHLNTYVKLDADGKAIASSHTTFPDSEPGDDYVLCWEYVKPTCQANGYWKSVCAECGGNYKTLTFKDCAECQSNGTAHVWETGEIVKEPTCTEAGTATQVCKVCGTTKKVDGKNDLKVLEAGHVWAFDGEPTVAPDCGHVGEGWIKCTRCDERVYAKNIGNGNYGMGNEYNGITVPKKHTWVKIDLIEATCEANAKKNAKYCTVCGKVEGGEEIANTKLEHNYTTESVDLCGYAYGERKTCTRCGYMKYNGISSTGTKVEANTTNGHSMGTVVLSKATCTTDGIQIVGACTKCDYVPNGAVTKTIAGGHKYVVVKTTEANCTYPKTTEKKCSVCNNVIYETEGKKLDKPELKKEHHVNWDIVKWIGAPATCTTSGEGYYGCTVCGAIAKTSTTIAAHHNFDKNVYQVLTPSTCSEHGTAVYTCVDCGTWSEPFELPLNGKCTYGRKVVDSNSCTTNSYVVWECLVCGAAEPDVTYNANGTISRTTYSIDANGVLQENTTSETIKHVIATLPSGNHKYGASKLVEATCTTAGGLVEVCEYCGDVHVLKQNQKALGHDAVTVTVDPTCIAEGSKTTYCYRCNETLIEETVPATGHDLEKVEKLCVVGTCSTTGYDVYECTNEGCQYTKTEATGYKADNHVYVTTTEYRPMDCKKNQPGLAMQKCKYCNIAEAFRTIPVEHDWNTTSVKLAATCTSKGIAVETCSVCSKTRETEIPMAAHTFVTKEQAATCTKPAGIATYCSVCSYKYSFVKTGSAALGHSWGDKEYVAATCEKPAHYETKCTREGCTEVATSGETGNALGHEPVLVETFNGSCVEKAYTLSKCKRCGKDIKVETNFNYDDKTGHKYVITGTYNNKNITCGNPGYADVKCELCNRTAKMMKFAPAHTYTDYICEEDIVYKVCTVCGELDVLWASDNFTGFDGCTTIEISNGKKVVTGTHKGLVVKASKDATCTEAGELGHIECTVCGTVVREGGVIPAHKTEEVSAKDATCTEAGYTAGVYCTECKKYVSGHEEIAAKGHKWVEVPAQDATATKPGFTAGTQCENCKEWKEGHEEIPVKAASLKRTAVLRKTAELLGERVALLNTDDAITITGELVNGFYPVSTADGTGYIHNSYIAVA